MKNQVCDNMRRKNKTNTFFLLSLLCLLLVGISYAYLSSSLSIKGQVSGTFNTGGYIIDKESNPHLQISNLIIGKWKDGNQYKYQYKFTISNIGDTDYDNFKITLFFNNTLTSIDIWNYSYELQDKNLIVINKKLDLKKGQSLEVNFIIGSYTDSLLLNKIKNEASTATEQPNPENFIVNFKKTNGWGNYVYQYDVTLTNKTGKFITYWQLDMPLPATTKYQSGWSAVFAVNGNVLTIKNASYNGRMDQNGQVTFGLQLETSQVDFIPKDYSVVIR